MRIYVPVTLEELATAVVSRNATRWDLGARPAHAVTAALVAALPDEDTEGHEYAAFLMAADDSLALVAAGDGAPLRVVLSLDVPDDAVEVGGPTDGAPSGVTVTRDLPGVRVEAVHADEPEAAADVLAVLAAVDADDDEALGEAVERVTDRDLLWYDPSEVHAVPRP
ncbi:hypothetical protein ATJ88_2735 [Isoptericola jiangsuensis]|uniref:Uncharacterized protein n=1 Tax=Isoptericola jiangsuensis TaxID=548579 RepID=A0A2A9EYS6_9MICO|nr:hypothetical protein [Isoptericola jiangsuensis]PFG44018.1 hypothetical protein ATJ88_2735 [Isoptericola jiangsuensis]